MRRIVSFLFVLFIAFPIVKATDRTSEISLSNMETPSNLIAKATTSPIDAELYVEAMNHLNDYMDFLIASNDPVSATKINQWLVLNKKYFTNQNLLAISETLKKLDEENFNSLMMAEYKDPTTALVLSIIIGGMGIDRFYIGDIGLGVGKLLTLGGLGIWWLVDIFCIKNATKKKNFEDFNQSLALMQQ